ncbi:MAG: hypothetical protein IPK81_15860 [Rhodospirillales bacterium]|nr:MAG: hypothetical protein IPK81_15860 [Rhodospirillales bacterium]
MNTSPERPGDGGVDARLLEDAAEIGARRALAAVGLHDADASKDVHELRALLADWRSVKTGVLAALGKAFAMAILGALAVAVGWKWIPRAD